MKRGTAGKVRENRQPFPVAEGIQAILGLQQGGDALGDFGAQALGGLGRQAIERRIGTDGKGHDAQGAIGVTSCQMGNFNQGRGVAGQTGHMVDQIVVQGGEGAGIHSGEIILGRIDAIGVGWQRTDDAIRRSGPDGGFHEEIEAAGASFGGLVGTENQQHPRL